MVMTIGIGYMHQSETEIQLTWVICMGADPGGDGGDVAPPTSERHEVVSPNINYF
jgi:hypothetical protein